MTDIEGVAVELVSAPTVQPLVPADTPARTLELQVEVANQLAEVIEARKLYANVGGKKHILVTGYQLLGMLSGVTAVVTSTEPIEPAGFKAVAEARRTTDGMVVGRAEAICDSSERMWAKRDSFARLGMAQTRAMGRALRSCLGPIVNLAGFEATAAEEFGESAAPVTARGGSVTGAAVSGAQAKELARAAETAGWSTDKLRKRVSDVLQVPLKDARLLDLSVEDYTVLMREVTC